MAKSKNGQGQGTVFKPRDGYWSPPSASAKRMGDENAAVSTAALLRRCSSSCFPLVPTKPKES